MKVHLLYNVYNLVRFHFPKGYESNTGELEHTVRMLDETDGWNINDADKIECLPEVFTYTYGDIGEVSERRVIVTPADVPMPLGRMRGYQLHVDEVNKNIKAWMRMVQPDALVVTAECHFYSVGYHD